MAVDCARISRLNCVATADQTIAVLVFFPSYSTHVVKCTKIQ